MNRFLIGAAAIAVAVPAIAQMQPATPVARPTAPMAPMMDRTQTRDQVVAKVRDHFAKMDANRDGFVAADEMQAMRGEHMAKMGGRHGEHQMTMNDETMRDGPVRDPRIAFDRLDTNHDGMISRDEFAHGREVRIERKVVMNGNPQDHDMGGEHHMMKMQGMHGGRGGGMGGGMMKMADANKDGRVSLPEATTAALAHFDMVDANHDGRITREERQAMHQRMMQEHGRKAG